MEDLRLAPVSFAMPNLAEVVSQLGVSGAEVLDLERFSGTPSAASLYAQLLTLNPAISSVAIATYQRGSGKTFCEEWERHIPLFGSVDWANCSVAEAVACLGRETGECRALSMTFEWNGEWVALPSVDFDTKAGVTVDFLKQIDQLCSELEVPAVVIHSGNGIHLVFLRQVYTDLELWKFSAKIMKRLSKISGIDCPWNNAVIEWVEQSGCLADFHDLSLDLWALAGKDDTTSVLREVVDHVTGNNA